jgi:hypothetical protein
MQLGQPGLLLARSLTGKWKPLWRGMSSKALNFLCDFSYMISVLKITSDTIRKRQTIDKSTKRPSEELADTF